MCMCTVLVVSQISRYCIRESKRRTICKKCVSSHSPKHYTTGLSCRQPSSPCPYISDLFIYASRRAMARGTAARLLPVRRSLQREFRCGRAGLASHSGAATEQRAGHFDNHTHTHTHTPCDNHPTAGPFDHSQQDKISKNWKKNYKQRKKSDRQENHNSHVVPQQWRESGRASSRGGAYSRARVGTIGPEASAFAFIY